MDEIRGSFNWDWDKVSEQLKEAKKDPSVKEVEEISRDEFLDCLDWMAVNDTDNFCKFIFLKRLAEIGMPEEALKNCADNPELLKELMKFALRLTKK